MIHHDGPSFTRRQFLPLLGATAAAGLASHVLPALASGRPSSSAPCSVPQFAYVGTYTAPNVPPGGSAVSTAEGIYVFQIDPRTGALALQQVVPAANPSFLAVAASGSHLYCVHEVGDGQLSAFAIDRVRGTLTLQNSAPSSGAAPTHLSLHPSGRLLLAANYDSGNFPVYRIEADGSLGAMTDSFQSVGNGAGPNPFRQEGPHAHQILSDPGGQHVFGVDLGADRINILNLDLDTGRLTPNAVPFASVASGSGPRHMVFHRNLPRAYVLDELVSTITVFEYDAERGAFIWLQTLATLPPDFSGASNAGEIRIHPSGRFLYSTNRGHDSVAMFAIDASTGKLGSIGWQPTGGQWPRGMNLDPSGRFLYAANQNSNTLAVFAIAAEGTLTQTSSVDVPTPADIEFGTASASAL